MVGMILMATFIIALIGALPVWLWTADWGYSSSTGLSLVFVILIMLTFTGG
ncbi:MAG TPA: DUF3309 family protein [Methylophilus sp.]|nr:DUF3309 family protein [Methylophilus sp.]